MRVIEENYQRIQDDRRSFDIRFWQSQGDRAIFEAVWEMLHDYILIRGKNANEFRFQRTVESFRIISRSDLIRAKKTSGRPQDKIDVNRLEHAERLDSLDKK